MFSHERVDANRVSYFSSPLTRSLFDFYIELKFKQNIAILSTEQRMFIEELEQQSDNNSHDRVLFADPDFHGKFAYTFATFITTSPSLFRVFVTMTHCEKF